MTTTITQELVELYPIASLSTKTQQHKAPVSEPSSLSDRHIDASLYVPSDAAHGVPPLPNPAPTASLIAKKPSLLQIVATIFQPSLVNFLASCTNGIITVGLPTIARDIDLPRSLYLWPQSVYGLTCGSMLLIAGSMADLIGPRMVELVGIFMLGAFTIACGVVGTGEQLVVFRALQGIAMAMHLPASVALLAAGVPEGKARNIGFACLGLSQPLGFSVGLVVGGIMVDSVGWRLGFYLAGGATLVAVLAAVWMLPKVKTESIGEGFVQQVKAICHGIDWVGGLVASGGLAILAYTLAIISADLASIRSATTASLLAVSLLLLTLFPIWMHYRERQGKPALVPNSLWKNHAFASTCIMVALANATMYSMELFSSLYFQEVQKTSALTASLYLLPNLVVGVAANLFGGIFVDRLPARWLVTTASLLGAGGPIMMALVDPSWSYWLLEFWAQALAPLSVDVLFTVGLIIVSKSFPENTQALAGAVFNTVGQFGASFGVGIAQVVALGVAGSIEQGGTHGGHVEEEVPGTDALALLKGYRASFWTMFAWMVLCGMLAVVGLRKTGKVGLKQE